MSTETTGPPAASDDQTATVRSAVSQWRYFDSDACCRDRSALFSSV